MEMLASSFCLFYMALRNPVIQITTLTGLSTLESQLNSAGADPSKQITHYYAFSLIAG